MLSFERCAGRRSTQPATHGLIRACPQPEWPITGLPAHRRSTSTTHRSIDRRWLRWFAIEWRAAPRNPRRPCLSPRFHPQALGQQLLSNAELSYPPGVTRKWRKPASSVSLVLSVVTLAGCGGGSSGATKSSGGAASLSVIAHATEKVHTYRFSTTVVLPVDGANTTLQTGEADLEANRASVTMSIPGVKGSETLIVTGKTVFDRTQSAVSSLAHGWCVLSGLTRSPGSGVDPTSVLTSLGNSGRELHKVGQEKVRGVATTHYRVSGTPPLDVWVDASDRLRRLHWTHGKAEQTDTTELFDFGTPVSIDLPANAPPCQLPALPSVPAGGIKAIDPCDPSGNTKPLPTGIVVTCPTSTTKPR